MSLLDDDLDEKLTQELILGQFHIFWKKHLLCSVHCVDTLPSIEMRVFSGGEDYKFYRKFFDYQEYVNSSGENITFPVPNVKIETVQHSSLMYQYEHNKLNISRMRPDLPIIIKDYYEESLPEYIKFPKDTIIIALDCNEKLEAEGCLIIFENTYVV